MPQMMPINWLFLFLFFICIFMLFNIINYYIFYYNPNNNNTYFKSKINKNNILWKW